MRIISSSVLLLDQPNTPLDAMRRIEMCGRVCYKSEGKITPDSYQNFIKRIVKRGHEAVLEHAALAVSLDSPKVSTKPFTLTRRGLNVAEGKLGAVQIGITI